MTTHAQPVQHNRPLHDGLHPFVYRSIIGLTIWLVLSIWAFFSRGGYIGLTLAMITFFFLIIVAIPVVIWKSWQHNAPPDETREPAESFGWWTSQSFVTLTGALSGRDAQYEASEAYIRSQVHAAWTLVRNRYDDGGFSGGSTDRPALQCLLADIRARKIDVIVVYKVDRLTRSLADFAKLVELFDGHGVSFVSVTQQFNTTTSMGRLTLNVLLSFAQFEREVTSERIRDKIGASKRKGLWVGGKAPFGYEAKDRKILVVEEEAERVRSIFRSYLKLGSIDRLAADLRTREIVTKVQRLKTGNTAGGIPFTRGPLSYLLRNRFYIGEVVYKGEILPGSKNPSSMLNSSMQCRPNLPSS